MLTSYKQAFKTWIFTESGVNGHEPIARVLDFVINPQTGIFEALWVQSKKGIRLISLQDIVVWNSEEILIEDELSILKPKDLPGLKPILNKEVAILGADVWAQQKHKSLGKVQDFAFDTISPRILSLVVKSGWWLWGHQRVIPRQRILKIEKKGITIQDGASKVNTQPLKTKAKNLPKVPELDCREK